MRPVVFKSRLFHRPLIYGGQAKTFTEVCADCMWRLKFQPVKTIPLDIYRLFEKWLDEQKETER